IEVNPFARGDVARISGQRRLPVLADEGPRAGAPIVISDSTRTAEYLETICPEPPIYPSAPEARTRVLMLEDWSDERFAGDLIPFKIFTPGNARRMIEQSKGFYVPRWYYELLYPLGPALLRSLTASKRLGRSLARI